MTDSSLIVRYTRRPGSVDRILSLLRRRAFPISSVTIERSLHPETGRMTVVVEASALQQVTRQLERLSDTIEVRCGDSGMVCREYAMLRVRCQPHQRANVLALMSANRARAISIGDTSILAEMAGSPAEIDGLIAQLEPYGIDDLARTNPIAVHSAAAYSA